MTVIKLIQTASCCGRINCDAKKLLYAQSVFDDRRSQVFYIYLMPLTLALSRMRERGLNMA